MKTLQFRKTKHKLLLIIFTFRFISESIDLLGVWTIPEFGHPKLSPSQRNKTFLYEFDDLVAYVETAKEDEFWTSGKVENNALV